MRKATMIIHDIKTIKKLSNFFFFLPLLNSLDLVFLVHVDGHRGRLHSPLLGPHVHLPVRAQGSRDQPTH